MQIGNWVPLDKRLTKFLPKTRTFTPLEAAFSLSVDYDNRNDVTVSGYAKLWGWSRTKVSAFFEDIGVVLVYPDDTKTVQKQKGQIKKQKEDRKETEKRQIRFIDSSWLKETKNSKKTEKEQEKDRSKSTTNDPSLILDPEPDPKPIKKGYSEDFENWWKNYPVNKTYGKGDKKKANTQFKNIPKSEYDILNTASKNYGESTEYLVKGHKFLKEEIWKLHIVKVTHNKKPEVKTLSSAERITLRMNQEPEQFGTQIKQIN